MRKEIHLSPVNEDGCHNLNSLVMDHFYWVKDKYEGWQPAQYAGGKEGHYFWRIGKDYEHKLGRELTAVGDEITIPNAKGERHE